MPKRKKGDDYCSYINFAFSESAANTWTTQRVNVPFIQSTAKGYMGIEITKIDCRVGADDHQNGSGVDVLFMHHDEDARINIDDPNAFAQLSWVTALNTNGQTVYDQMHSLYPGCPECTGFGIPIATQSIYIGVEGTSQTSALNLKGKIWYKMVSISLQEYVGITQSQTTST